ncbi:uncharacterized protein BO66DRAFT_108885 [Aspergillus aculeatinus CBS 121060]|uniref:Uncharacterized protein n=1 Tax=Aspergillus aculeatinus CBS 121060 TaxID=1448322 RepID=A0ACD1HLQ0_9EURO|nr:hypothetical protein BO66DRAFT_108885 [Aspergillus aculeatinus CBS 121060]RAH74501.1 hypothetical protein BO66DRAFT_108885 [Aspergillus aculeatinus CBS 121060]
MNDSTQLDSKNTFSSERAITSTERKPHQPKLVRGGGGGKESPTPAFLPALLIDGPFRVRNAVPHRVDAVARDGEDDEQDDDDHRDGDVFLHCCPLLVELWLGLVGVVLDGELWGAEVPSCCGWGWLIGVAVAMSHGIGGRRSDVCVGRCFSICAHDLWGDGSRFGFLRNVCMWMGCQIIREIY